MSRSANDPILNIYNQQRLKRITNQHLVYYSVLWNTYFDYHIFIKILKEDSAIGGKDILPVMTIKFYEIYVKNL